MTYHNAENGFCVLRVKARARDLVVVTGHAAVINASEFISATGWWINDREHGLQFKASTVVTTQPTTLGKTFLTGYSSTVAFCTYGWV